MGVVYRAKDPGIGRQVAIKTMSGDFLQDNELRLRFLREARSAGQLQHPNIVTVHELLEESDNAYIVMELLEGASLYSLIRKRGSLDIAQKISILLQIAGGLNHAHEHGIVHRDLKPSNIFVSVVGVAKVLDFGVAKFGEGELTRAGTVFGTLEYMAPEQVQGQRIDARADIFAMGVVAYELLTGTNPFRAETMAASVFKILSDNPDSLSAYVKNTPPALEAVIFRALSKTADKRFQSLAEMAAALQNAAQESGIEPRLPELADHVVKSASREAVRAQSEAPQISQWSNVAAAAGQLDEIFRQGIECFSKEDFEGCVSRMSEVLDAVPVHSMALHYLAQSEERLRQKRLDSQLHKDASELLSHMRKSHRDGEPQKVIEEANKLLEIDPESMEARWYRRNAETRLMPSSHTKAGSVVSKSRFPSSFQENPAVKPTIVMPAGMGSTDHSRSVGIWVMGGAGLLSLAFIAMIWGFSGSLEDKPPPKQKATATAPTQVRPSEFENEEAVLLHLPNKKPIASKPSINSMLPKELVSGVDTKIRLFGSNFEPGTRIVTASVSGDVDILTLQIVSEELIEATLLVSPGIQNGEISLFALNPDGARSTRQVLQVVPADLQ
jgi:serine/threonine protein kinase